MSSIGIWLAFCLLSLTNASDSTHGDFLKPFVSDTVRIGATIASGLLNPQSPSLFQSVFHKLTEEINKVDEVTQRRDRKEKTDLILIVLKLMNVDSRKVTEFAFDGMISLVYLVAGHLAQMLDPNLVDSVLKETEKKLKNYPEKNVECIKLLICKTKPFVRGMQRSLIFFMSREGKKISANTCEKEVSEESCRKDDEDATWEKANLEERMYFFVPDMTEVVEWGDRCDQLFQDCIY